MDSFGTHFAPKWPFGDPLKTSWRKNAENDSPGRAILGPHFEAFLVSILRSLFKRCSDALRSSNQRLQSPLWEPPACLLGAIFEHFLSRFRKLRTLRFCCYLLYLSHIQPMRSASRKGFLRTCSLAAVPKPPYHSLKQQSKRFWSLLGAPMGPQKAPKTHPKRDAKTRRNDNESPGPFGEEGGTYPLVRGEPR